MKLCNGEINDKWCSNLSSRGFFIVQCPTDLLTDWVCLDRNASEGMKMAVAHFQCAAWAFHSLPDLYPQDGDSDSDLSRDLLALLSQLCLAQVSRNLTLLS